MVLLGENNHKVRDLESDDDDMWGDLLFFLRLAQLSPYFLFALGRLEDSIYY